MCSAKEHVTKDWALEIVFEMGEPMRRAHNCRPLADYGIGKAYAVWRDAVLDVLLHAVPNGDMRPILSLLRQGGNLMQLYCYRRDVRFGSKADIRKRSCPLYPQKRTCAVQTRMSAMGQKRTSPIYSITSSARDSSACGTVRPSAFAVLWLMCSSTLVTCCTGRSAGLSPLRMRPV